MESVAQATGRRPDALNVPPCPDVSEHVWHWFLELHSGRQGGGMGPSPLAWSEIESWSRQMGTQPHAWEIEAIKALDMAWLRAQAEEEERG